MIQQKHIFAFAVTMLIASILLVGHLNYRDIENCVNNGNSRSTCIATYNP